MDVRSAVAVDWSGARADGHRRTWLAEVVDRELVALCNGWSVESLGDWLIDRATKDASFVAGLDFAFGFPAWFVEERFGGLPATAWEAGEELLGEAPFWGRPGERRSPLHPDRPELRVCEAAVTAGRPKSVFQVGGAGSVGTGSIRGKPLLRRLRQAGFAIWPFDPPRLPLVVEIYPRALTGPVVKSNPAARRHYLDALGWPDDEAQRRLAGSSEDAFDAAISALRMWQHRSDFSKLPSPTTVDLVEGRIWLPVVIGVESAT